MGENWKLHEGAGFTCKEKYIIQNIHTHLSGVVVLRTVPCTQEMKQMSLIQKRIQIWILLILVFPRTSYVRDTLCIGLNTSPQPTLHFFFQNEES